MGKDLREVRRLAAIFPFSITASPLIQRPASRIADAAAQVASKYPLASLSPPCYDDLTVTGPKAPSPPALHPRIAVLLGVSTSWHVPLLVARALSTVPAMWWGLRCAFTFLGDLLLSNGMGDPGNQWTVEKRFRVTEIFLAILWVRRNTFPPLLPFPLVCLGPNTDIYGSVRRRHTFRISSLIVSCPDGQMPIPKTTMHNKQRS